MAEQERESQRESERIRERGARGRRRRVKEGE